MKEKDYYTKLGKYFLENSEYNAVEVKITKTNRFNYKNLPPRQERAITISWYHKISDQSRGEKPVDLVFNRKEGAVVIIYYKPRASVIIEIPAHVFIEEKYKSGNKSLHIDRAREIGREISP